MVLIWTRRSIYYLLALLYLFCELDTTAVNSHEFRCVVQKVLSMICKSIPSIPLFLLNKRHERDI